MRAGKHSTPAMASPCQPRPRRCSSLTVVLPTILAILYYGFIASDVYVSESQFVVRSPDKPTTSGLGVILKTAGFSNASDEIYSAQSYVLSRDALRAINRNERSARPIHGRRSRSSTIQPDGYVRIVRRSLPYYRRRSASNTILSLRSARCGAGLHARGCGQVQPRLLEMAEATVNRLNVRGRQDLIRFAQTEVDEAEGSRVTPP